MEVMGDIYFTIIAETEMILTLLQRNITKYFYCLRILFPAFLLYFGSVIISILSNKCFQSLLLFFQTNVMWEENDMFQIYRRNSLVLDTLVRLETFIKIFQFSFDKKLRVATEVVGVRSSNLAIQVRTSLLDNNLHCTSNEWIPLPCSSFSNSVVKFKRIKEIKIEIFLL